MREENITSGKNAAGLRHTARLNTIAPAAGIRPPRRNALSPIPDADAEMLSAPSHGIPCTPYDIEGPQKICGPANERRDSTTRHPNAPSKNRRPPLPAPAPADAMHGPSIRHSLHPSSRGTRSHAPWRGGFLQNLYKTISRSGPEVHHHAIDGRGSGQIIWHCRIKSLAPCSPAKIIQPGSTNPVSQARHVITGGVPRQHTWLLNLSEMTQVIGSRASAVGSHPHEHIHCF
jgi:hypothetical protein